MARLDPGQRTSSFQTMTTETQKKGATVIQNGSHHVALRRFHDQNGQHGLYLEDSVESDGLPINGAPEEGAKNNHAFDAASATPSSALTGIGLL